MSFLATDLGLCILACACVYACICVSMYVSVCVSRWASHGLDFLLVVCEPKLLTDLHLSVCLCLCLCLSLSLSVCLCLCLSVFLGGQAMVLTFFWWHVNLVLWQLLLIISSLYVTSNVLKFSRCFHIMSSCDFD